MVEKIICNMVICLIMPLLNLFRLPFLFDAIFYQKYIYYDFDINSFSEFFYYVYGKDYFIIYFIFLLFILFPFQLIKDYYFRKDIYLPFFKKVIILMCIIISFILLLGTFSNIWVLPWWKNLAYVVYSFIYSLILSTLTYYSIDKYVEYKNQKK